MYNLSVITLGCVSRLSGEAEKHLADRRNRQKKLTALPHSIHLSSSPKHQCIHFHMTTAMGTTRNGFTSEPELFIIISLSVCKIIYVLQLWKSKTPVEIQKDGPTWISKTELRSFCGIHLIILDCSWQNPLYRNN